MEQGWIKSYRKIMDNHFLMNDNTAYIVFTKLLHLVNSTTGTYTTGRFALSERTNIKPNTLYKALIRLEDNGLVTLKSNNRFTDIHICKWKSYQHSGNNESNIQVTSGEQQSNNKVTLNKNKEVRIKKEEVATIATAEAVELVVDKPKTDRVPSATIDAMFAYWESVVGYAITSKKKQNREYAAKLFKEYSKQEIASMLQAAALASEEQYAPGVSDFIDLYRKWDKLKLWGKKQGGRQSATARF